MNQGFILMHRQLIEWEWYNHIPCKVLFLHCLLRANHTHGKWRGHAYKRGEFITSIQSLSTESGLTIKQTRNALEILVNSGELGKVSTAVNTLITVTNYDKFQSEGKERANERAKVGQSEGKGRAKVGQQINNEINENNVNNETKEITPPVGETFDFKKELISLGVNNQVASDFMILRKSKKAVNSNTAFSMLKKEIEKSNKPAQQCIEISILRNWQTYKHEWDKPAPNSFTANPIRSNPPKSHADFLK